MRAFGNDILCPVLGRSYLRIQGKSLLGDDAIDVVFGMIDMTDVRHYATDSPAVLKAAD